MLQANEDGVFEGYFAIDADLPADEFEQEEAALFAELAEQIEGEFFVTAENLGDVVKYRVTNYVQ